MWTVEGFWSFHVIPGKNYSKHGVGNHKPTFPAGTTRPLRVGLVRVYICIWQTDMGISRNCNHVIENTHTHWTLHWGDRTGWVLLVSGAHTHTPVLLVFLS